MKPNLGRVVLYKPTEKEKQILTERAHPDVMEPKQNGESVAAFIVWCESNEPEALVNLIICGEHGGFEFVRGITQGDEPGQWSEPPRV